ncbi:MAG TPA: hypothetical protein VNE39_27640 [Planctomycetota bacterium]|nr:hypothetical protein [Planctomycetota bacterium]
MARIAAVASVLIAVSARAATLGVGTVRWGFDGKVVPGRINVVSVEVVNPSPAPFDGLLRLYKDRGLGDRAGAPLVEPCFLSPGATRWVQFYPYVRNEYDRWFLDSEPGAGERCELGKPKLGPPARVLLHDPEDPLGTGRDIRFPLFADPLFPPTVAATDGLDSVLLDHVPRWEPVKSQAFLDWVRRGGELHLLHDRSGRYPVFGDELAVLNASQERQHVGAGLVLRHALSRREVSNEALAAKGCPPRRLITASDYSGMNDLEDPLLRALSSLTRPRHAWGLIYFTAIAYMVVLGPLNFVFGRKRRNYRLTLLFFLLSVAAAAAAMYGLGRRGHGEATAIHSLACARQIDADTYDVTQWVSAFVTRGATYDITHDAPHNLYSCCEDHEAIRGAIANGKDGVFRVDIPLYSHRGFLHRAKLKGHHVKLSVVRWRGSDRLEELALAPEPGFPDDVREMWAVHGDSQYRLTRQDGELRVVPHSASAISQSSPDDILPVWQRNWRHGWNAEDTETPPEEFLGRFWRVLMAREMGGTGSFHQEISRRPPDKDHVRVFLFARAPQGFEIKSDRFGKRLGFVLYCIDLFRPEDRNG